jgi:hypothetical protein
MSPQLPVIAIVPSLRNDYLLLARDLVPDGEIRSALIDPESLYRQRRAEIRLLLDLLLPAADVSAMTTRTPLALSIAPPTRSLVGRQLLR